MADSTTIRACDVLNQALPDNSPPLNDNEIEAQCSTCGSVRLGDSVVSGGAEPQYTCTKCGSVLVVIGQPNPDGQPWPGRGYRLKGFVVRNAVDLTFRGVLIPSSPNALAPERSKH